MNSRIKFGLIGKDISYSFSKKYFLKKFQNLGLNHLRYANYDLPEIEEFPFVLYQRKDEYRGFNVTIPYKEAILKYLDDLDEDAKKIGAINTIKLTDNNQLIGYNTDVFGFQKSLEPLLKSHHKNALILGTGGASKAVAFALKRLHINFKYVSRKTTDHTLLYEDLDAQIMENYQLIINCTPLGTFPNTELVPKIPFQFINDNHLLYDLIYNPPETTFLKLGKNEGAVVKNGGEMLELQAEKSWEIWNS